MIVLRAATVAATSVLVSSCATLVAPGPDIVHVVTNPPGAEVSVDGRTFGMTPTNVEIGRRAVYVKVSKPGFEDYTTQVPRHINPWAWGSVLLGLGPIIVDVITNNEMKADSEIHVELRPTQPIRD